MKNVGLRIVQWLGLGLMLLSLIGLVVMLFKTGLEITDNVMFIVISALVGIATTNFASLEIRLRRIEDKI